MNLTNNLYGQRPNGRGHGDVYTSSVIVGFMLDLMGYTPEKDLSSYTVLEPSFGEGIYLIEIWHRLVESAKKFNFDPSEAWSKNIYGCELDPYKYKKTIGTLTALNLICQPNIFRNEDFLCTKWDIQFDFIVGNPPYVRYEQIPLEKINRYKTLFSTFHYRCDLYVLFYEHCLRHLSNNGRHCFICSNRWLKNEYGRKLRGLISSSYNLEYIIDVENIDAFDESVLAYPSITLISNSNTLNGVQTVRINSLSELKPHIFQTSRKYIFGDNWDNLFLDEDLENLSNIEQEGFKIGIGVATGADKIFISKDFKNLVEQNLLIPIISAKDLTSNKLSWKGKYLLNPYTSTGSVIDINRYPLAKQYLEGVKNILTERHIVKKGRCWYSLIDKVKGQLLRQPKILLPDISGNTFIFVDKGDFYPAHNIYYVIGRSIEDLELLAAILMSKFVHSQIENISNKMNGGIPRWQCRSIKKLKIPKISNISPNIRETLINAYHNRDLTTINTTVANIVKTQQEAIKSKRRYYVPHSLFDHDFS